jgi:hypothetical protein
MWSAENCVDRELCALLAIDVGVRTGLALYNRFGRLVWYRSKNFGTTARLRRGARSLLENNPEVAYLVLEGGGTLADIWAGEAVRLGISVRQISAAIWRKELLYPREQRSAALAKQAADTLARRVITWSDAPRPTSLRHDAAEAILIGLWAVVDLEWLPALPDHALR